MDSLPFKCIRNLALAFIGCIAAFSILLVLVYCIPTSFVKENVRESALAMEQQGGNYNFLFGNFDQTWRIDNYTISVMLNIASHNTDNPVEGAFATYEWVHLPENCPDSQTQVAILLEGLDKEHPSYDDPNWWSYARYWHGYLVVLKPLLCLLNLTQIQMLFFVIGTLLLLLVSLLLARRESIFIAMCFALPFLVVDYTLVMVSLPFAFSFLVALVGCMIIIFRYESLATDNMNWPFLVLLFFLLGAITVFFDLLDTPLISLGIPLALLLFLSRKSINRATLGRALLIVVVASLSWFTGYGLLWISRWLMSSAILGQDVIADAFGEVSHRSNARGDNGQQFVRSQAITSNFDIMFPKWTQPLVAILILLLVASVAVNLKKRRFDETLLVVPLAVIASFPYIWFFVVSGHSIWHFAFTYRIQAITIICLLFAIDAQLEPLMPKLFRNSKM